MDAWIQHLWTSGSEQELERLQHAIGLLLEFTADTQESFQPRSLEVGQILRQLGTDHTTLLAALLSDPRLIPHIELEEIAEDFGQPVAALCENMRVLHMFRENTWKTSPHPSEKQQADLLRRMLLAMVKDVRVVLIKLAWHLQYLRLLSREPITQRHQCAANQTMEVYAPLANWLGISHIKWELEDLAFRFLQPETYREIAKALANTRLERENYIREFIEIIQGMLDESGIKAKIYGRPKHIYSIWRKMQRKGVTINQLYDLRAIRIIVDNVETCYEVLGMVHERWGHIPEEWDDYISNRKPNGYQSIHTVVIGPRDRHVEIQIRNQAMHKFAELGVAAHWRYKDGTRNDRTLEHVVANMRRLLDRNPEDDELLEDFRTELFGNRVFVLTPKGRVVSLTKGATPIDFAYAIHTDIGHRCQGAKVNGAIVPLNYELHNGEQVEILTGKEARPRMNWLSESLGYIKSNRTRQKINHWFRQQDHDKNYNEGQSIVEHEKHMLNLPDLNVADLARVFNRQNERDFLIALGRGDISPKQLADTLIRSRTQEIRFRKLKKKDTGHRSSIVVRGVEDLYTQCAQCCQPVYGDSIIGFITHGRGISVHRSDCPNILHLPKEQANRLIEVSWGGNVADYAVDILVSGYNKPGLLRDIADVLARGRINVLSINTRPTVDSDFALLDIAIQIEDTTQLSDVLERLMQLPKVTDAQRRV